MAQPVPSPSRSASRRTFLKTTAAVAGAAMAAAPSFSIAAGETKRKFKLALIGCGGRGNGALNDHLEAIKYVNQKLGWQIEGEVVATGDWFEGKAKGAGKRFGGPAKNCFGGADCYKKVLECKPDIVIMGQPPAFRPIQFEAAIKAGAHVFFEKPSAVDPVGVRRVIKAGEDAKEKGLCVVAGTQRRHDRGYNERYLEIKDGAYGKVVAGRVAWNMGGIFTNTPINAKSPDQLVGPWQIWSEMSGDHICEQHVHNLDIANWYVGTHPIAAGGFGFRARRKAGNMYDFFSADLEYPNNVHVHSMCRQIADCWDWVGEDFNYEKQKPNGFKVTSADPYAEVGYHGNAYVGEHAHLIHAIVKGTGLNEAKDVAWATAAAILIRESAYSGKRITWDEMFENPTKNPKMYNLAMKPSAEDFEKEGVTLLKDGDIRIPGA